jgi:AmmeMemoRadiSam system protein B
VILGIAHAPCRRRYALTTKGFATPLGELPADREFIEGLRARCRTDLLEEEFLHRSEHSIEFQALLLRYVFRESPGVKIVPVLCSSLPAQAAGEAPESDPEAEELIAALRAELAGRRGEVYLVAGADLAHVGRRFGQELSLSPLLLQELERQDREMIGRVLAGDAAGFFRGIQREKDRRNVCGVPAIYTLLRLLEPAGLKDGPLAGPSSPRAETPFPETGPEEGPGRRPRLAGRLLEYGQAPDPASDSVVTFMSAAFYDLQAPAR